MIDLDSPLTKIHPDKQLLVQDGQNNSRKGLCHPLSTSSEIVVPVLLQSQSFAKPKGGPMRPQQVLPPKTLEARRPIRTFRHPIGGGEMAMRRYDLPRGFSFPSSSSSSSSYNHRLSHLSHELLPSSGAHLRGKGIARLSRPAQRKEIVETLDHTWSQQKHSGED